MKVKKFAALLLVVALVFSLVACSSGGGGGKPSPVGSYTLSGMEENGEAKSQEDLDLLASMGLTLTMEVREDKTGMMDLFGEQLEFEWDDESIIVDGVKQPYTFDGTTLTMENDGTKMTFTLNTDTESDS